MSMCEINEVAAIAQALGTCWSSELIEAVRALLAQEEADKTSQMLHEIMDLEDEKAAILAIIKKHEQRERREAARYARERERARVQAYRLMMKHHKAREVMRFKRRKRIYGGLM